MRGDGRTRGRQASREWTTDITQARDDETEVERRTQRPRSGHEVKLGAAASTYVASSENQPYCKVIFIKDRVLNLAISAVVVLIPGPGDTGVHGRVVRVVLIVRGFVHSQSLLVVLLASDYVSEATLDQSQTACQHQI